MKISMILLPGRYGNQDGPGLGSGAGPILLPGRSYGNQDGWRKCMC